jgi:hypothetical protein
MGVSLANSKNPQYGHIKACNRYVKAVSTNTLFIKIHKAPFSHLICAFRTLEFFNVNSEKVATLGF